MRFTKEEKELLVYLLENEIDKLFKRKATEEFRKKYGFIGNWEEMQYWLEMCPDTSFLFENIIIDFSKALDSNTKRVRKEYEEEIEDLKFEMREIDERRDL